MCIAGHTIENGPSNHNGEILVHRCGIFLFFLKLSLFLINMSCFLKIISLCYDFTSNPRYQGPAGKRVTRLPAKPGPTHSLEIKRFMLEELNDLVKCFKKFLDFVFQ